MNSKSGTLTNRILLRIYRAISGCGDGDTGGVCAFRNRGQTFAEVIDKLG